MNEEGNAGTAGTRAAVVAWMRMARIYQRINQRSAATFAQFGLSVGRFDVLNHAGRPEGKTQQELAESLLVTKGNVTQILDAMERDGLIERRRDGRFKRVYLTDTGRKLRQEAVAVHEALLVAEFAALDDDSLTHLHQALRTLDRSLQRTASPESASSPEDEQPCLPPY